MLQGKELVGHWVRIKHNVGRVVEHMVGNVYEIKEYKPSYTFKYYTEDEEGRCWTFQRDHFTLLAEESELGRVIYGTS